MNTISGKRALNCFLLINCFTVCMLMHSCKQPAAASTINPMDYAAKWTADMKVKIIKEATQEPDRTVVDTVHHYITYYKNNIMLKQVFFAAREDQNENEKPVYDTGRVILYSTDQKFQLFRQPCIPKSESSYEGVLFKGDRYGLAEYNYCKKNMREVGFQVKNLNVGIWNSYDSSGKVINTVDNGNVERLEQLKNLH